MGNAKRDDNYIPTLLAVSNVDGTTPVTLYADPVTHRLLVSASGGGDVSGPASSTDNAVVRFNGGGGKTIQNSGVTIDDSSNIAGLVNITQTGYTDITEISAPSSPASNVLRLYAMDDGGGFSTLHEVDNNGFDREIGRDTVHTVRNTTGSPITKGSFVYINGSNGTFPTVALADASSASTSKVLGMVVADISNNSFGQVIQQGDLGGLDTQGFTDGQEIFLSTTAGEYTATTPSGTDVIVSLGTVIKGGSAGAGIISLNVSTKQDPTLTQTLTNKTLTSPRIGTDILDTNGNELFKLTATASAVNEFTVANAATGNGPTLSATGGDTNIDLNINSKGTGNVVINSAFRVNASTGNGAMGGDPVNDAKLILRSSGQAAFDLFNESTAGTPSAGSRWRQFADLVGGGGGQLTYGLYDVTNTSVRWGIGNDGAMGLGTTSPARHAHFEKDDATNSGVTQILRLAHTTNGTPSAGIGTGLEFVTETSAGNNEIGATVEAITTDVTGGSEDFDLVFKLMAGGATASEVARFKSTGVTVLQDIDYSIAYGEVNAIGNLGASETFDFSAYTHFTGTLDQNTTLDFSNATSGQKVTIALAYDGTAQRTITWTPTIKWGGGSAPTAPDASGEVLVITVAYLGTTYYGSFATFS